jgi:murein DD-endopeptidase MepM/ murein hydrolase activator NlpD
MTMVCAALFACFLNVRAAHAVEAEYTVRAGDNLTTIARRFGADAAGIRRASGLSSDTILVGQRLKIPADMRSLPRRGVRWSRPVRRPGEVLRPFGPYTIDHVIMPRTGAALACPLGTAVTAPADGVVRHVGHLDGFGVLVLTEHGGGWVTVLAPFDPDELQVREGQAVLRGDPLGATGEPDDPTAEPYLHVELRDGDKAVAPDRLYK